MTLESIFSTWDFGTVLHVEQLNHQVWTVDTSTGAYVLKRKPNLQYVVREKKVLDYLQSKEVSAHRILDYFKTEGDEFYCLYPFFNGEATTDDMDCTHGAQMGREIGLLHASLASFPECREFPTRDLYEGTFSWVLKLLETSPDESIKKVGSILRDIQGEMTVLKSLPKHLLHRDAHGGNMIFENGLFRGFIDFDIMETNVRLFDPCYCSVAMFPNRFDDVDFKEFWLPFLKSILDGYNRVNPLTSDEKRSIWHVLFGIEALFVAFFMGTPHIASRNAEMCIWLAGLRHEVERVFE